MDRDAGMCMVEENGAKLRNMPYFPATVVGSFQRRNGITLVTLGDGVESNIMTYYDDRPAHRVEDR